jgi:hypothetical protein
MVDPGLLVFGALRHQLGTKTQDRCAEPVRGTPSGDARKQPLEVTRAGTPMRRR